MDDADARQALAKLRALKARADRAAEALTVRRAAEQLDVPQTTLYRLVGHWHRRPRRLNAATQQKLAELIAAEASVRDICRRLAIGEGTVTRRKAQLRANAGLLARVPKWRCPGCGSQIELEACVACRIERNRGARQ